MYLDVYQAAHLSVSLLLGWRLWSVPASCSCLLTLLLSPLFVLLMFLPFPPLLSSLRLLSISHLSPVLHHLSPLLQHHFSSPTSHMLSFLTTFHSVPPRPISLSVTSFLWLFFFAPLLTLSSSSLSLFSPSFCLSLSLLSLTHSVSVSMLPLWVGCGGAYCKWVAFSTAGVWCFAAKWIFRKEQPKMQ